MRTKFLLFLLLSFFIISSCKKIVHKHQLLDQDGKWIITEQKIKITHYDGEVTIDTVLYNTGYFNFKKYSRKEIKEFEKSGTNVNSNVVGFVSYSMWIPTVNTAYFNPNENTKYILEKSTMSADWSSSHVPGFKPLFIIDKIEIKTNKIGKDKQEWVYEYGRRTSDTDVIEHILILERE